MGGIGDHEAVMGFGVLQILADGLVIVAVGGGGDGNGLDGILVGATHEVFQSDPHLFSQQTGNGIGATEGLEPTETEPRARPRP